MTWRGETQPAEMTSGDRGRGAFGQKGSVPTSSPCAPCPRSAGNAPPWRAGPRPSSEDFAAAPQCAGLWARGESMPALRPRQVPGVPLPRPASHPSGSLAGPFAAHCYPTAAPAPRGTRVSAAAPHPPAAAAPCKWGSAHPLGHCSGPPQVPAGILAVRWCSELSGYAHQWQRRAWWARSVVCTKKTPVQSLMIPL